jgi:ABC-type phosphate transport system substrate-binding protein
MKRFFSLFGLLLLFCGAFVAAEERFYVIVNSANPLSSMEEKEVSKLFLKKTVQWPNGQPALPVDQSERSSVRENFSKEIHGKTISSLQAYWQQQIFSGRNIPPPEKNSDSEVIAFVNGNPNAIGYVSAQPSDVGVKVLKVIH